MESYLKAEAESLGGVFVLFCSLDGCEVQHLRKAVNDKSIPNRYIFPHFVTLQPQTLLGFCSE